MKINEENLFQDTIKQIQSQFGKNTFYNFEEEKEKVVVTPTGSIMLDNALGCGGYPKKRIIEIYGNESCGKTTLALQAIAQAQKAGSKCAYLDLERALDAKYCTNNGIDIKNLIVSQPETGEQTFSVLEALIKTDMIDLIVVDSVAAMVPEAEFEGDFSDQTMGLHARIMSKGMRIIQPLLTKHNVTIIFINQIREKIGITFGNNETTTGGRALKFYASIRIELKKAELLKKGDECIGIKVAAKVTKNKLGAPLTKAMIDIFFDKGFDPTNEIIEFAIEKGVIEKKGS
jgi:recombination protein RecA